VEIEAKLLVPPEVALDLIAQLDHLGPYRLRPRRTARLHSLYVDTPKLTLAHHRVALRLRRRGRRWEMTAKWMGRVCGMIHERPELTVPLAAAPRFPFVVPVGPLRARLGALVGRRGLRPILVTDIHRRLFDVFPQHGEQALAELALDHVRLAAPTGSRETYDEIEIEAKGGSRRDVARIARLLRERFGLLPSPASKFARGLALLDGVMVSRAR
jgi:triphosphatase